MTLTGFFSVFVNQKIFVFVLAMRVLFLFLAKASKNSSFQEPRSVSIHSLVSKLPVTAFPLHSWFHHFILRLRGGQGSCFQHSRQAMRTVCKVLPL